MFIEFFVICKHCMCLLSGLRCRDHLALLDLIERGEMTEASERLRRHLTKVSALKSSLIAVVPGGKD